MSYVHCAVNSANRKEREPECRAASGVDALL